MSTNKSFWKRWLEGKQDKVPDDDKAEASASSEDSLEEGLKGLSLIESGKAVVSRFRRRKK